MKKILLKTLALSFILAVFAGFVGCNTENVDWEPAEISVNPTPITFESGEVGAAPAPIEVEVVASRNWEVSADVPSWLNLSVSNGSAGRTAVTIIAEINPDAQTRSAKVMFMIGRVTATLSVSQKGEGGIDPEPTVEIYKENVGTKVEKKPDGYWPFVDEFAEWSREGTISQTGVMYTGSSASIRNSGGAYQPAAEVATGAPYVFLGAGAAHFQIEKINITGHSNFTFKLAVSHEKAYVSGTVTFNSINSTSFKLEASVDGTNWTALPFTNDATEGWVVTKSEFKTGAGANELYVKISNPAEASKMRFDDFTLIEGGNGTITIGDDTPPSGDAIYSEKVGSAVEKVGGYWPYVDEFTGWSREGTLSQAGVMYTGSSASIRNSGAAYQPAIEVATGAPYVFLGTGTPHFQIERINITGHSNFTFKLAVSYENAYVAGSVTFHPITSASFKLEASVDGTNWTALPFTNDATEGWVVTTSEFKTGAGIVELYIKISEPAAVSKMRFDDFTLITGGNGTIVIGGSTTPVPVVVTNAESAVTETTATLAGAYTLPTGAPAVTEAGIAWQKTGDATFTKAVVAGTVPGTEFTVSLTGLVAATGYSYYAYVMAGGVEYVGSPRTFTTTGGSGATAIYLENMGSTDLAANVFYPGFAAHAWQKGGVNQTGVTYFNSSTAATKGTSIRFSASAISKDYPGASGGNRAFLGTAPNDFEVREINVTGQTDLIFTFGISRNIYGTGNVAIDANTVKLSGSIDGTAWTPLSFTNDATAGWVLATSKLQVPAGSTKLWLKFDQTIAVSEIALDDFTLAAGGSGGTVIGGGGTPVPVVVTNAESAVTETTATLAGAYTLPTGAPAVTEAGIAWQKTGDATFTKAVVAGTVPGTEFTVSLTGLVAATGYSYYAYVMAGGVEYVGSPRTFTTTGGSGATAIYLENMGSTDLAANVFYPGFAAHAWQKGGVNQTGVTYFNSSTAATKGTSIRFSASAISKDYPGASGGNRAFLGTAPNDFEVREINVTGQTDLIFTFGISRNIYGTGNVAIDANTVKLSGSIDGTAWTPLSFTNDATAGWVLATSKLQVPAGSTKLWLKFDQTIAVSEIALDDFTLAAGGSGGTVIGGGGTPVPVVVTNAESAVTETTATLAGAYTLPTGAPAVTEAGIAWQKTGDATFTKAVVAGTVPGTEFTAPITGLVKATGYTYYAYVMAGGVEYVGSPRTFTTTSLVKSYISLAELRAKTAGAIADDVYVKGSIISGTNSISKRNVIISDGTAGIAIKFVADYEFAQEIGKEIEIHLKEVVIADYNGLMQLNNVPNANAAATGETNVIPATPITAAQLLSGSFESMYVAVSGVQVMNADLGKKMSGPTAHTSIKIQSQAEEFDMFTSMFASFIADVVPEGSGVLKGIGSINVSTFQVLPQVPADYAAMTNTRLPFPLKFGAAEFVGDLEETVAAVGNIVIPYEDAKGTESYNVTVVVGGAGAAGITVDPITVNLTMVGLVGNGEIEIPVTGTPTASGEVTFTVSGITELTGTDAVATATVLGAGAAKTFEGYWNMFGIPLWGDSPMDVTAVDNSAVTIGGLDKTTFTTSGAPGNNNWGGSDFSSNIDPLAPVKYAEFTVTSTDGALSIASIEAVVRITKTGPIETVVLYQIDGGGFTEASRFVYTRPTGTTTFPAQTLDLSGVAALQGVAQGAVVTIRLVPLFTAGTTTGNWYLNSANATTNALIVRGAVQ